MEEEEQFNKIFGESGFWARIVAAVCVFGIWWLTVNGMSTSRNGGGGDNFHIYTL